MSKFEIEFANQKCSFGTRLQQPTQLQSVPPFSLPHPGFQDSTLPSAVSSKLVDAAECPSINSSAFASDLDTGFYLSRGISSDDMATWTFTKPSILL